MRRLLLTFVTTFSLVPAVADEIAVTEFVPGTIISSADMNQNFDKLVQESNENDARISELESNPTSPVQVAQSGPAWVDANGDIVGYPLNTSQYLGSGAYVFVRLPETDLVVSPSYFFNGSNGVQYFGDGVLSYSLPGCKGDLVLWTSVSQSGSQIQFGVTIDGFYAYPGDAYPGEFYRQSYVAVDQRTGERSCKNDARLIMASYASISAKEFQAPLAEPVLLRWR